MEMEFWGVEVKSGEPLKCDPGEHTYVHLSQVALGEIKKDKPNENIPIYVKFDDKKLVIGTLSTEKCSQVSLDLIFEKEFELSHGWKNGSVYFCGYKSIPEDEDDEDSDSDPENLIPLVRNANGKPEPKAEQLKPVTDKANAGKPDGGLEKAKPKSKPDLEDDEDDDDSDDEDDDNEDESDEEDEDEEMQSGDESDEDDEDEDEDSSADEETPEKAGKGKKRLQESATKTPGPEKKAKLVSPDGVKTGATGGKKGGHVATPYPSKTAGKTPGGDKAKQHTPNSQAKKSGQVTCKSCSKTFGSEQGLESHTKAKHSASAK